MKLVGITVVDRMNNDDQMKRSLILSFKCNLLLKHFYGEISFLFHLALANTFNIQLQLRSANRLLEMSIVFCTRNSKKKLNLNAIFKFSLQKFLGNKLKLN